MLMKFRWDYRLWSCKMNQLSKIHINWNWQRWRLSKTKHFSQIKRNFTLLFVLVLAAKEQKQSYEFFTYVCHNFTVNMWCGLQSYCHWVSFRQGMTSFLSCWTCHMIIMGLKLTERMKFEALYMKLLVIFSWVYRQEL